MWNKDTMESLDALQFYSRTIPSPSLFHPNYNPSFRYLPRFRPSQIRLYSGEYMSSRS